MIASATTSVYEVAFAIMSFATAVSVSASSGTDIFIATSSPTVAFATTSSATAGFRTTSSVKGATDSAGSMVMGSGITNSGNSATAAVHA